MKRYKWELLWGIGLTFFSFIIYFIHYLIFRDIRYIWGDLLSQLAYLPLYIFLTSIVIERLLSKMEKKERLRRLNTVIGVFISELGKELLEEFTKFDLNFYEIQHEFTSDKSWTEQRCIYVKRLLQSYKCKIDYKAENIHEFIKLLEKNKQFLIEIMGNPNLMENEEFTELVIAVFHLLEELRERQDVKGLEDDDFSHISGDMERVYHLLINVWIGYMVHLKEQYPFLYSFALRTNPFIGKQKLFR